MTAAQRATVDRTGDDPHYRSAAGVVISRLGTEHGDDARCLAQGLVGVVSVHGGQGRGVLVASDEPSLEAVPSHFQSGAT
jgi:hypothetical protein